MALWQLALSGSDVAPAARFPIAADDEDTASIRVCQDPKSGRWIFSHGIQAIYEDRNCLCHLGLRGGVPFLEVIAEDAVVTYPPGIGPKGHFTLSRSSKTMTHVMGIRLDDEVHFPASNVSLFLEKIDSPQVTNQIEVKSSGAPISHEQPAEVDTDDDPDDLNHVVQTAGTRPSQELEFSTAPSGKIQETPIALRKRDALLAASPRAYDGKRPIVNADSEELEAKANMDDTVLETNQSDPESTLAGDMTHPVAALDVSPPASNIAAKPGARKSGRNATNVRSTKSPIDQATGGSRARGRKRKVSEMANSVTNDSNATTIVTTPTELPASTDTIGKGTTNQRDGNSASVIESPQAYASQTAEESDQRASNRRSQPVSTVKKKAKSETENTPTHSSSKLDFAGARIVFSVSTVHEKSTYKKFLAQQGISITNDVTDEPNGFICISGPLKTTPKILMALVEGQEILSDRWVTESHKAGHMLNPADFRAVEELSSSQGADRKNLFQGKDITFTRAAKESYPVSGFDDIFAIAEAAGANVNTKPARDIPSDTEAIVIGLESKDNDCQTLLQRGLVVYQKSLISDSIVRAKLLLDDERHKISGTGPKKGSARSSRKS